MLKVLLLSGTGNFATWCHKRSLEEQISMFSLFEYFTFELKVYQVIYVDDVRLCSIKTLKGTVINLSSHSQVVGWVQRITSEASCNVTHLVLFVVVGEYKFELCTWKYFRDKRSCQLYWRNHIALE